ncbi:DUF3515 domain-containing protein [Nesterenkonia sp. HG001]|uniref:DUF3515 domain-containing protein n=1 Tax=Nesterenkonia sp. HG001 TaxID=2983207 RepID=UPI002AC4B557|nr:DUF3515 domain-containing protein [Nesterenkonia sp. HG001]MDZ5078063.1 DUF3515 domain-containing protein [Nesterenkonia sp. HG001]
MPVLRTDSSRRRLHVPTLIPVVATLTACSGGVASVEPAPHAADPLCAQVMLALPEVIGEHDQRETDSQGTAVWGDPSQVVVRCGVEPPGPSPEHCVSADGVDWLALEEGSADWRLISYGRQPAVEVLLDVEEVPSSTVMLALSGAVERIDQTRECTSTEQDIEDTADGSDVSEDRQDAEEPG